MPELELRTIGVIGAPHGLQGTVKLEPLSDFPERYRELETCYLVRPDTSAVKVSIKRVKIASNHILISFDSINTRDEAEQLRGAELCIREDQRWPLPDGTYYITDIVGFRAVGDDGTDLGSLTKVIRGPQDIFQINGSEHEVLVPFVKEWVGTIDTANRTIEILNWRALIDFEIDIGDGESDDY